jgi:hypothetical protein
VQGLEFTKRKKNVKREEKLKRKDGGKGIA